MTDERRRDREMDGTPQRAALDAEVRLVEGEGRRIRFIASTEKVGRDGDIIRAKGWDVKTYMRNPVFLWAHDPGQPPIGRVVSVEKVKGDEPRLEAEVEFAGPEEGHDFADTVYRLYRRGFLKAVSVGFLVRAYEKPTEEERVTLGLGPYGMVITGAELLELSAVPVPADPGAIKIGKDSREMRGDLVRMRDAASAETRAAWDALIPEDTTEAPTITIDSIRDLLSEMADELTERLTDSVVESMAERFALRQVASDATPPKPAVTQSGDDLYRLRDAIEGYLSTRKGSH